MDSVVSRQPVLARLLGRSAAFPALDMTRVLAALEAPLKVDFGCQTPVHFVEKHIDYRCAHDLMSLQLCTCSAAWECGWLHAVCEWAWCADPAALTMGWCTE